MSAWKEHLTTLGFQPTDTGVMGGRFEDIDIVAVEHLLNGLCFMGSHFDGRGASQFETFIAVDSDFQTIAAALLRIHDLVHPKNSPVHQPEPARKRPFKEEALVKVPEWIRKLQCALDKLGFLFQRHLMPAGCMDQKIGEIIAAYVTKPEIEKGTIIGLEKLKQEKLVLDWCKQQTTRARVLITIQDTLDKLPRTYTKELSETKCGVVYQHFYEAYLGQGQSVYTRN